MAISAQTIPKAVTGKRYPAKHVQERKLPRQFCHGEFFWIAEIGIAEFEGIEEIRTWSNVVIAPLTKNVGDFIADSGSFAQVIALIHFTFDSLDECKNMIDKIHKVFRVLDENGNDLIARKLDWDGEMINY